MIARLRQKLAQVPGAPTYLQPVQDLRIGGFASAALYQYTLRGESLDELNTWGPRVFQKLRTLPELTDVNSDQQDKGLQSMLTYRPGYGLAFRASRRRRSTTPSTTPSGSARWPSPTRP